VIVTPGLLSDTYGDTWGCLSNTNKGINTPGKHSQMGVTVSLSEGPNLVRFSDTYSFLIVYFLSFFLYVTYYQLYFIHSLSYLFFLLYIHSLIMKKSYHGTSLILKGSNTKGVVSTTLPMSDNVINTKNIT